MYFVSNKDQTVTVSESHYCGDGCCGWRESASEYFRKGNVWQPEFYGCDTIVDEDYFFDLVNDGDFDPTDKEAQEWFDSKFDERKDSNV